MRGSHKTLFTIFLGILFFIPTFTANSAEVKTEVKSEERCIPEPESRWGKIDGKRKFIKKNYCISLEDIAKLGTYQEFNEYPEGMLKVFKNCKKILCQSKKAGSKLYKIFVQRTEIYHQRHPGKRIHGMAWFEIMYLGKLKKTTQAIERYSEYKKGNYNYKTKLFKTKDEEQINSLIKMNKGRTSMREAMGMSADEDLATVLRRHWLLGDMLNNNEIKAKKVKMDPEMKKRKELLEEYQATLKKYKKKIEEEREKIGL